MLRAFALYDGPQHADRRSLKIPADFLAAERAASAGS
jgi:hypothetical protein